jgi:hypothetical protein
VLLVCQPLRLHLQHVELPLVAPSLPSLPLVASSLPLVAPSLPFLPLVGPSLPSACLCLQHVELPLVAPSLGGVETLATRPVLTTHVGLSAAEREAIGIHDGLIRVSVGIEGVDDLLRDLLGALDAAAAEVAV